MTVYDFETLLHWRKKHKAELEHIQYMIETADYNATNYGMVSMKYAGLEVGSKLLVTEKFLEFLKDENNNPVWREVRMKRLPSLDDVVEISTVEPEKFFGDDVDDGVSFSEYFIKVWIAGFFTYPVPLELLVEMRKSYLFSQGELK